MKTPAIIVAAACAAFPVLTFAADPGIGMIAGTNGNMDNGGMNGMNHDAMMMNGKPMSALDTKDIQTELGVLTDAVASSDPLTNVTNNLSKADRDRIGSEQTIDSSDLTKAVDQFRKDWQAKYGQDFMASDKASVIFSDQHVKIMQGNTPSAMTGSEHPFNPNTGQMTNGNGAETEKGAVAAAQNISGNGNQQRGGDIKTDAAKNDAARMDSNGRPIDATHGKDTAAASQLGQQVGNGTGGAPAAVMTADSMAMVMIPSSNSDKSNTLNLVNDGAGAGWKAKLAGAVTNQQLHDSLLKHVNMIEGMKADWPSDVNEAYLAASKHLLMGVGDAGMQNGM